MPYGADSSKKSVANASELDFFGCDAAASAKKPVEKRPKQRERKMSVDMVPKWAGNEDAAASGGKKKTGSKQSRKRKLSEGAIEEQKLEDDERKQASLLLAPPKLDKAQKRKLKKQQQRRARADSIGTFVMILSLYICLENKYTRVLIICCRFYKYRKRSLVPSRRRH